MKGSRRPSRLDQNRYTKNHRRSRSRNNFSSGRKSVVPTNLSKHLDSYKRRHSTIISNNSLESNKILSGSTQELLAFSQKQRERYAKS